MTPEQILQDTFGFGGFRPGQRDIIENLIRGQNTLAVMPTGAGKSMCYQIPALMGTGLSIVVSPLVALMDDQVAGLWASGVNARCIHSGLCRDDQVSAWRAVTSGQCPLLYLSPERLMTDRMIAALGKQQVSMIVIDEAHCMSKWGVSFRPEYEQLARLTEVFPDTTIAAFTATADRATREDIVARLFNGRGQTLVQGFDRPNLCLGVQAKADWKSQLAAFLADKQGQSGIVYCLSRKFTEQVCGYLSDRGLNAIAYHAGLDARVRKTAQDRFMSEDAVIMVATIAFGMGIDKPDIRYVVHLNLPGSMEAYYQEIGRAGRDGAPAVTCMLFGFDDLRMRRQFIEQDGEDDAHKLREHKRLDALMAYCEAAGCRRRTLLAYFDEEAAACNNCDNCLNPPVVIDGTQQAQVLMRCIKQTGQFFGSAHIIDVLRGADTQKIRDRGHNRLSAYGTGAEQGKAFWQGFIRQAIAGGYLSINVQKYGCLELTPRGHAVMDQGVRFSFREMVASRPADSQAGSRVDSKDTIKPLSNSLSEPHAQLFSKLKSIRLSLARQQKVPAFVIFSDATLLDMIHRHPTTREEMLAVNGVGPGKLANYGDEFLAALHQLAHDRDETPATTPHHRHSCESRNPSGSKTG